MDFNIEPSLFVSAENKIDDAFEHCEILSKSAMDVENSCPPDFPLKFNAQLVCDEIYGMREYLSALVDDVANARANIESLDIADLEPKKSKKKKKDKSLKEKAKSIIDQIKEKLGLNTGAKTKSKVKSKAGMHEEIGVAGTGTISSNKIRTLLTVSEADAKRERAAFISKNTDHQKVVENSNDVVRTVVLNDAKSYAGKLNYVSGGTSLTNGADCSGFTQAIYAKNGYSIGRTTWDQKKDGVAINATQDVMNGDYSKLKEGDLIICSGDGHVVMYAGNNEFIHSPHTGAKVRVDNYRLTGVTAVRRIIN